VGVSPRGIRLWVTDREFPCLENPVVRDATIAQLHGVVLRHGHYLRWPDLDVDLEVEVCFTRKDSRSFTAPNLRLSTN